MSVNVRYDAPPTLSRFMESDAFVRCCVGPVGSGKSSACVVELLRRAMEQAPGPDGIRRTRWAIIRNTYSQLRDTTRKTFEQWVPLQLGAWHEQQFSFELKFKDVHAEVLFRALDRPEDIKKLLSLELTGAYINEAREIPKDVFEILQTRVGRYPSKAQGGPSWFGIWLDTNPWHTAHWGYKLFSDERPEGHELFEQPDGLSAEAENVENLPLDYYSRLVVGKDAEWIDEYIRSKYPRADKGSIYGHLVAELKARGGICDFEHPRDGVFLNLDLGISDSTSLWWWRISKGVDLVDHYEAHGEPLSHFFDVIAKRNFQLLKIWLPHDAKAKTLITGQSIWDRFIEHFGQSKVHLVPQLSLLDGIQAFRWLLEQETTRIHARCSNVNGPTDIDGIHALRSYRYEYDDVHKVYRKTPAHDWSSHTADSGRYVAVVAKVTEMLTRQPAPPKPVTYESTPLTMDSLWAEHDAQSRRGGRI